jgi:hypothetical protein
MRRIMYDADSTRDRELTTEQIASAGTTSAQPDVPAPTDHQDYPDDGYRDDGYRDDSDRDDSDRDDTAASPAADHAADPGRRARLLDDGELQGITARWKDIQAEFVEEPKVAVQQADALVAELMQRLAAMFATERAGLENRWAGGNEVSTEDLRQGLRLYHSFFERLLAA